MHNLANELVITPLVHEIIDAPAIHSDEPRPPAKQENLDALLRTLPAKAVLHPQYASLLMNAIK